MTEPATKSRYQSPAAARATDRSALFDEAFIRTLEQLHMVARKLQAGGQRAERKTKIVGAGIEFADYRQYARGDDFRYIDWNLYGRLDKLLLRLFEEEQDLHIYFLVDVSDSMALGSPPKLHYAMKVAAALSYVGLANLDRVSIVSFSDRVTGRFAPTRGKSRIFGILDFFRGATLGGGTDMAAAMRAFVAQTKRPGLALVISDFYDTRGFAEAINILRYAKFEPFVLQVFDPKEAAPQLHGDLTLVDCETGDEKSVTISPAILERYKAALAAYQEQLEAYCKKYAIAQFRTATSVSFEELVLRIFRTGGFLR
ncbi:MAG: DUF58 domain-containing protein [Myxococcales bacterium]|nr:DUF58 domain-containing protein [Myxococcales bacterium]